MQTEQTVENNMMSSLPRRLLTILASTFCQLEETPNQLIIFIATELHI